MENHMKDFIEQFKKHVSSLNFIISFGAREKLPPLLSKTDPGSL